MNLGVGSEAEVKRRNHLKIFQTLKENQLNQGSGLTPDESLIWFKQKTFFILPMFFVYPCLLEGWTWVGIQIAPSPPPSTSSGLSRTNSIPFGSILNSCSSWGGSLPSRFAKRNDSITEVHTAVTGTLISDCGRSTLLFVRRYIQWPKRYQIKCNFFIASPDLFNQAESYFFKFFFCKSVF